MGCTGSFLNMCVLFRTGGDWRRGSDIFQRRKVETPRLFKWGEIILKWRSYYEEPIVKRLMTCSMKAFSHSAEEWMMKEAALQKASWLIPSQYKSLQPLQHRQTSKRLHFHLVCLHKLPQICIEMMLDVKKNHKLELQSISVTWRRWSAQSCIVPLFVSVQDGWLDRLRSPSGCAPLTDSAHMGAWYFKHENLGKNEIGKARH